MRRAHRILGGKIDVTLKTAGISFCVWAGVGKGVGGCAHVRISSRVLSQDPAMFIFYVLAW